jgi:thioredoxin-dependent peroxiredoxin
MRMARRRSSPPRRQVEVGDAAPEFVLHASDGRTYRLIDYRHKQVVVLVWFPKAFTSGCTVQCQSIGAHVEQLRATGAVVFGANVDTPETNRQFAAAHGLAFPILSDPSGTTARAYGVLGASGLPSRWTFFIGVDGRVVSIDRAVRVSTNGRDIERALEQWTGLTPAK